MSLRGSNCETVVTGTKDIILQQTKSDNCQPTIFVGHLKILVYECTENCIEETMVGVSDPKRRDHILIAKILCIIPCLQWLKGAL